jgi:uncharacterized membrane protein
MDNTTAAATTGLERLNRLVGRFLQIMILFSLLFVAAGLLIFALKAGTHAAVLTPAAALPAGIAAFDGAAFVTAGLYIILLMPLVILITSFTHFISASDKKPVIVCAVLLAMLVTSYVLILK